MVRLEEAVICLALLLQIVSLTLQVAARFGLPLPLDWTEELARNSLPLLVFVGAALGARRAEHFAVEIFMDRVNFPGKHVVARAVEVVVVAFFCLLAWVAVRTAIAGASQTLPTLGISIAWANAAIPLGCALMAFHFSMAWIRPLGARQAGDPVTE